MSGYIKYMYCRVCGFELRFIKDVQGEKTGKLISVSKCNNCGSYFSSLDFVDQNVTDLPEDKIDGYLNNENDVKLRIKNLFSLVDSELFEKNNKRYLDIGCGVGWSLTVAKECGFDPYGIEPQVKAVKFANEKLGLNVINDYFSSDLFEYESFDLIVIDQVLEHLPNPRYFLADAFKLLKPGGILFLGVPPLDWSRKIVSVSLYFSAKKINQLHRVSWLRKMIRILDKYDLFISPEGHVNYFTAKSIKILAEECGAIVLGELHNNISRAKYFPVINLTTGSFVLKKI